MAKHKLLGQNDYLVCMYLISLLWGTNWNPPGTLESLCSSSYAQTSGRCVWQRGSKHNQGVRFHNSNTRDMFLKETSSAPQFVSLFLIIFHSFQFQWGGGGYWTVVEENFGAGNPWARLLVRSVYGGGPLSFVLYCVELLRIAVPPPPTRTSQAAAAQHFVESSKTLDKLLSLFCFFSSFKRRKFKEKKRKKF